MTRHRSSEALARRETPAPGPGAQTLPPTDDRSGARRPLTCHDHLFCGCGGFTLGLERAGFRTLAAVDVDPVAVTVYRHNFPLVPHVLQRELTAFSPAEADELFLRPEVDVIVGGLPYQGFSNARRRDSARPSPVRRPRSMRENASRSSGMP